MRRSLSSTTRQATVLLGKQIRLARKQQRLSEAELAARVGIARSTLQRIERGDTGSKIGVVFEAALLLGIPLFDADPANMPANMGAAPTRPDAPLAAHIARLSDKLALLPASIRNPQGPVHDDF